MRQDCSWQHRSIPERMLGAKDIPLGACFLLGKTGLWGKNAHASTTDKCTVSGLDKQDTRKKTANLTKKG